MKPYHHLKYFPGDAFAYNRNNEIIGTVDPDGTFHNIDRKPIPKGEKRA